MDAYTSRKIAYFQAPISSKLHSARSRHSPCLPKPVFSTNPQVHGPENPLLYREFECIQIVIRPADDLTLSLNGCTHKERSSLNSALSGKQNNMAATMENDTTSTSASDGITTSNSGRLIVSGRTAQSETVQDRNSLGEAKCESVKNEKNSTESGIQDSVVFSRSSSSTTSVMSVGLTLADDKTDEKQFELTSFRKRTDVIDPTEHSDVDITRSTTTSARGKPDAEGFKLPGLPLIAKSSKSHSSPTTHGRPRPTTDNMTDDFSQDKNEGLENKMRADKSTYEETTGRSHSEGEDFAFPKPKLASISKATKQQQNKESMSGDASEAVHVPSSTAALPVSTEKKPREKSPAEKLSKAPPLPYKEPSWSGIPKEEYHLEVLKGGAIIAKIALNDKAFHVFGRLETCDVPLEHPSLSRYHLVLQYRVTGDSDHDPGFYLYDLESTHGSWLNKQQMAGKVYYRMRVGHLFKLGGSTRMYILQGPLEDQEAESDLSVKELKELRQRQLAQLEERKMKKTEAEEEEEMRREEEERDAGISWGMDYEDADDADAAGDNPFAIVMTQEEKEATYIKDPKKALRGYFEREGHDLEYSVEEKESGFSKQFVCRVELPLDDASGRPIHAEAASSKKKEAVAACALEACRILDTHGVLRQATHESHKRKAKNWKEDDYYDSDEDTFLDRTGEIERKRMMRMKKAGVIKEKAQTYDSLKSQLADVEAEIEKMETEMSTGSESSASSVLEDDSLDAFMASIKSGKTVDRTWRAKLKLRVIELKKEQARLTRLVDIAKPAAMPALQKPSTQTKFSALTKKLPMFGSMRGRGGLKTKLKTLMPAPQAVAPSSTQRAAPVGEDEEEEEDEQEDLASPPAAQGSQQHTGSELPGEKPVEASRFSFVSESASSSNSEAKSNPSEHDQKPSARKIGPSIPIEIRKRSHGEQEEGVDAREDMSSMAGREMEPREKARGSEMGTDKTGPSSGVKKAKTVERLLKLTDQGWEGDTDDVRRSPSSSARQEIGPGRMPQEGGGRETGSSREAKEPRIVKGPLKEREMEETEDKEDFADWMPPVGQTGDGRTHLNAKFGY